ncbi:MAG: heme biosynthesis HemY N-terminal domain-containing protein [Sulfurisoma sp.]|nr:heme biosynthesis HemY N-terminal domain-containing protein [Sulfurisoma sp.]
MRALLWLLLLAALAVGLSLAARYNDGYALFVLPPWRVEISLNLLLLLGGAGFVALYWIFRSVGALLRLPRQVGEFRARRARGSAERALHDALRCFAEGRFSHALKNAEKVFDAGHAKGLAAVVAWRAAHALRDPARESEWRRRAEDHADGGRAAVLMTEAELAVDSRDFAAALAALDRLAASGGRHIGALRLALRAHQGQGNWREVARLARQLEKYRALSAEQAAPLRRRAHAEVLKGMDDAKAIHAYWREVSAADRLEPRIALEASRALVAAGDRAGAAQLIEEALDEHWDSSLIAAYAQCPGGDVLGRIAHCEKWLHERPRDAQLLLALGRLCRERQLWGKAQSYLEASLAVEPTRAAHVDLAQLLDSLEKSALAERHYRAAAVL